MFNRIENGSRRREVSGCRESRFRRPRFSASYAALLLAATNAACYRYVPISGAPAPNEDVRINITEDAAARLSKDLAVFSTTIEGQYAQQGPDSVSVAIPVDRQYRGVTIGTTTQTLYLGRSEIVDVRRRQFDRGRTVLLSAGIVAGFAALAAGITQIVDPNNSETQHPPPPPPESRIPAFRGFTIRIPLP